MNKEDRKYKLEKILGEPGGIARVQIVILNDLCIKLVNEKNRERRKEIRKEIEAVSMATDSILRKQEQDIKTLNIELKELMA